MINVASQDMENFTGSIKYDRGVVQGGARKNGKAEEVPSYVTTGRTR